MDVMSKIEHGYGKGSGGGRGGGRGGGNRGGKFNKHTSGLKFVKKVPKFLMKYKQPSKQQMRENNLKETMSREFREDQPDEKPVSIFSTFSFVPTFNALTLNV